MRHNPALAKMRRGKPCFGPILVYSCPDAAEQVAHLGFDWVWLDWQHGQFTEPTLHNALARFQAVDSAPIVRVKGNEPGTINRVLDMGAMGIVVPMIQNAEEAKAAVEAAYYPPIGRRSAGGIRLGLLDESEPAYWAHANDEIMLIVMVETEEAIGNVRDIMQVPGIDVVLIGPGDLMIDVKTRGHGEDHHERLVQDVVKASLETGTAAGYVCLSEDQVKQRVAEGFRFIHYGFDHMMLMRVMNEHKALFQSFE